MSTYPLSWQGFCFACRPVWCCCFGRGGTGGLTMNEKIKIGARARVINPRSANYGMIVELIRIWQPKNKNYTAYDFKHQNRRGIMSVTNLTLCQFLEFINDDKNTCEIPVQLSLWEG